MATVSGLNGRVQGYPSIVEVGNRGVFFLKLIKLTPRISSFSLPPFKIPSLPSDEFLPNIVLSCFPRDRVLPISLQFTGQIGTRILKLSEWGKGTKKGVPRDRRTRLGRNGTLYAYASHESLPVVSRATPKEGQRPRHMGVLGCSGKSRESRVGVFQRRGTPGVSYL